MLNKFFITNEIISSVYVLQLVQQKWYIGTTNNFNARLNQHMKVRGSAWTQLYRPVNVHHVTEGGNPIELWYTLRYMEQYGIDNVRGGPWTKPCLSKPTKKQINGILMFLGDRCFRCGEKGHFASNCDKSS